MERYIVTFNILPTLDNPPTLRLINFNITGPFRADTAINHEIQERRDVPGTLRWLTCVVILAIVRFFPPLLLC
jgi:hypothetical protein